MQAHLGSPKKKVKQNVFLLNLVYTWKPTLFSRRRGNLFVETVVRTGFCEHHIWEIYIGERLFTEQFPFVF